MHTSRRVGFAVESIFSEWTAPVTIIAVLTGRHRQIVLDDCCQNFLPVDILVVLFGILFRMHDLQKLLLSLFCTAHASCQKIDVLGVFDSAFGEIPVERTAVIEIFPAEIAVDCSSLLVSDTLSGLGLAVELPFRHDHFCLVSIGAGIQRRDGIGVVFQQVEDGERIFDLCLFFCQILFAILPYSAWHRSSLSHSSKTRTGHRKC